MSEKEEVLQKRAVELAKPPNAEESEGIWVLEFALGTERYAIDVSYVRETTPCPECTNLPDTPPYLLGVISIRQRIFPTFDLCQLFSIPRPEESTQTKVLVVEKEEKSFALLVDEIYGTKHMPLAEIQPSSSLLPDKQLFSGVTKEKTIIIDGNYLINKKEFVINKERG